MKNLLDDHEIEIPCEKCGCKHHKTIGWIKSHNKFPCACGVVIALDSEQFKSEIAKAERSLAALQDSFKKFGK